VEVHMMVCANSVDLPDRREFQLGEIGLLRYATDLETMVLDQVADALLGQSRIDRQHTWFGDWISNGTPGSFRFQRKRKPRRYVVLETTEQRQIDLLQLLALILVEPLVFSTPVKKIGPKFVLTFNTLGAADSLVGLSNREFRSGGQRNKRISDADMKGLVNLLAHVGEEAEEAEQVLDLIRQYVDVLSIPIWSSFRFSALMALIEGLLAHQPKPTDPTESITRQIKRKFDLVNSISETPLQAKDFFPKIPDKLRTDQLWTRLYSLRSNIAHGNGGRLESQSQYLVDVATACKYLDASLRMLFRQWIAQPAIMSKIRAI